MATIPVIAPVGGSGTIINSRYTRLYNNPHFDYLTEMMPKDIKQLFQWCEIVYNHMPIVANGIRKLINYPLTDFTFESDAESLRDKTRQLLTDIRMKTILLDFGTDYYVYGNVFRSVYMPFKRFLICKRCSNEVAIDNAAFKVQGKNIMVKCANCGWQIAELKDRATDDLDNIRIVRWDPKLIEVQSNPITGHTEYFYALPQNFVQSVKRGDLSALSDTPKIFIDAALAGRNVSMNSAFYHAKTGSLSGYASGWGIPPLMSTLKNYMYIAVLRRASEAIGMEQITPQRIIFPQGVSSDPSIMTSLDRWKQEIQHAIERWRMDPNYIMTAPYPTGIVNIGSQGRGLIPTEEIKDARMEMALALDIPPNIIMGDTNLQHSAISLRILENQLTPYVQQLNDFANWVIEQINAYMRRDYCKIGLVPFKLADDVMNKQILMSMVGQAVSKSTIQEILNLDPDREKERMIQDQLTDYDTQAETQKRIQKKEQNASEMAQAQEQEMASGMPSPYNQQKMIAQAQEQAMQFLQVPYEQRRSMLAQLQNEDYVMWALVSKQMEQLEREQGREGQ